MPETNPKPKVNSSYTADAYKTKRKARQKKLKQAEEAARRDAKAQIHQTQVQLRADFYARQGMTPP